MKKRKICFGIIGCGDAGQSLSGTDAYSGIGEWHAKGITEIEGAALIAVADIKEKNARALAEKFGVKDYYLDYRPMLARDDIDAVCICTPSGTHGEIAMAAARAGKHVVVEKPMEITVAKADALISACQQAGVKLQVVFPFRYGKGLQAVKKAIDQGIFGKILLSNAMCRRYRGQDYYRKSSWRGTWAMDGGGACMNQGIHIIDAYLYLLGSVSSVYANMGTMGHPGAEVEDTATAVVKFKDGSLGMIEATTCAYPDFGDRIDLYGEKGSVILEGLPPRVIDWRVMEKKDVLNMDTVKEEFDPSNPYFLHKYVLQDMVNAIRDGRSPEVHGLEGKKSLSVIEAIYRSAREGRSITIS